MVLLHGVPATSCLLPPPDVTRSHSNLVAGASHIFLAVAVGSTQASDEDPPVRYALRVVRVLKGKFGRRLPEPAHGILRIGQLIELPGAESRAVDMDHTFSNHADAHFWQHRMGRLGMNSDCSLSEPDFIRGRRYLIFIGDPDDTKDLEEVDTDADAWLRFVTARTAHADARLR
jgi:hypothetical protein